MPEHKATLAELNERIKLGPYHQWLGVEVTDLTADEVVFHIPFRETGCGTLPRQPSNR